MPTTFEIPSELRAWIEHLKQHKADPSQGAPSPLCCSPDTLWVLKTAENLGEMCRNELCSITRVVDDVIDGGTSL